jgi:hypothetical protein
VGFNTFFILMGLDFYFDPETNPPNSILDFLLAWIIGFGFFSAITAFFILLVFVFTEVEDFRSSRRNKDVERKTGPGFIRMKYQSWKNKFCPAIEVEND